jgi:hypothetical protein
VPPIDRDEWRVISSTVSKSTTSSTSDLKSDQRHRGNLHAIVLIIVLITKFTHGAWIVTIAVPLLLVPCKASAATITASPPN